MIYAPGQVYLVKVGRKTKYVQIKKCFSKEALCLMEGQHRFVPYDRLIVKQGVNR